MENNSSNLEQKLNNNLISLFFRNPNNEADKVIFNENLECRYHINSIHNIEKQLFSYGIYHCTPERDPLNEFGYYYASNGCVLVGNISTREYHYFIMFIPQFSKCDIENCNFIRNCLLALKSSDQIDIHQINGEFFKSFEDITIDNAKEKIFNKHIYF